MHRFMDFHPEMKLPEGALRQMADDARSGKRDQYGVRVIDVFHSPQGGLYCYLEGPSEETIRQHHAALGVTCEEVRQVESLFDIGQARTV